MNKLKPGFFLFFSLAIGHLCFAQNIRRSVVDSLMTVLKTARADTNQLHILNRLGRYYLTNGDKEHQAMRDTALIFFNKELDLAGRLPAKGDKEHIESLCCLGETYLAKDNYEQGRALFVQAADYYGKTGDKKMQGKILLRFGEAIRTKFPVLSDKQIITTANLYEKAAALFITTGDSRDEITAYLDMAYLHSRYYQSDEAEADCLRAIKKYKGRFDTEMSRIYFRLSIIERYRGNLNKALQYALESIKLTEKSNDKNLIVSARPWQYGELALIYDALGLTENSIIWYKKCLALRENLPIKLEFKYRTAGFIAQGLIKQKKFKEAFDTVLGIEKRHPPDNNYSKAIISEIKANCYNALGNYKKAEELYLLSLKLFGDETGDEIVTLAKYDVAKFYIKMNEYKKAAFYLNEGLEKGMSITMSRDWNLIFYKIDSANGNFASALQHHIQYKRFNDSIFNLEKNKQIQELQIRYETDQKEHDIQSLKKNSEFEHEKVEQANNMRNLTLAGSALLIVVLGLIYRNYKVKQRTNDVLSALVKEKDGLLKEKEWLIKEIHHRVKNNLQIVMGLLQRQSAYIDNQAALQAIQNSESRMHSIALIHQKLYQSENLDLINMAEYINELVSYLKETTETGNQLRFEKDIEPVNLNVSQAVPLGLILNEAITNSIKYAYPHGECGIIKITLKRASDGQMVLTVEDDGQGIKGEFDFTKSNTLGMNLMKGLSKQIGGKFELGNQMGVTVRISFHAEQPIKPVHELVKAE